MLKNHPRQISFHTRVSGQMIFDAMRPPWNGLDYPLVRYEVNHRPQVGLKPWLGGFVGIIAICFMVLMEVAFRNGRLLLFHSSLFSWSGYSRAYTIDSPGEIAIGALVIYLIIARWRLFMAIAARTSDMIAGRRMRRELDLILLSPVPRRRWLWSQLIALGWHIWPLVRGLIVAKVMLLMLVFYYIFQLRTPEVPSTGFERTYYLPTVLYLVMALPHILVFVLEPALEAGIVSTVGLYYSSTRKYPGFAMTRTFGGIWWARIQSVGVWLITFWVVALLLSFCLIGSEVGVLDAPPEACCYCLFLILGISVVFSFFWEWLPLIGTAVLGSRITLEGHVILFFALNAALIIGYWYTSVWYIEWLFVRTAPRLERHLHV